MRAADHGRSKRLKTAKGRRLSSIRWLTRQLRDPYVAAARRRGYRSRAAFKLVELDDRFRFLKPGGLVVDLGAAPGGWSQVAAERVKAGSPGGGAVVAVDCEEMDAIAGVGLVNLDFLSDDAPARIGAALDGPADVVLSDMAAPATGHAATDHLRVMALLDAAYAFAREVLKPGGVFVGKVLRGGTEKDLLDSLKRDFRTVRHVKPPASRKDSAEIFVIATDFRGSAGQKS
ncbi:MAG: RlmE family RNA methyltransferase [Alphaproteobacteria bacterium]|nr:RlmE family RNA methyltransferase [Alphaproteobacteria bacterium]MCZ6495153.1 RlmE family RNA methyltransferase [Alphaproteobacteria bacterium]MCZ6608610.1 RlmE family RNA methyltransferase [Alphaproteobacteria bacterium]MCZ6813527.1 RlmE family RNA methyltransferase [Alphaproteobacteria bacterium]MCZ6848265.1 RlmE family RNA methyltransferase [Alphaproteobacteria bacterium]